MRTVIRINGRAVPRGAKELIGIDVGRRRRESGGRLPVCVFRGSDKGPSLLITAGLHGDELNGIEAIRRMMSDGSIVPDAGTVIALPMANVWGFLNSSRFTRDGRDLNRGFPGSRSGAESQSIALAIMRHILPMADFGIDLHSGGVSENFPHIRCAADTSGDMKLARAFAPPFILDSPPAEGTFRKAARLAGKSVLVFEGGRSGILSEFAVTECVNGILRLMDNLGMILTGAPERNATTVIEKTETVSSACAGDYSPLVTCGAEVKKGDILARVSDTENGGTVTITSPADGFVLSVRPARTVNASDPLITIALPS
jgi:predicted deacylase